MSDLVTVWDDDNAELAHRELPTDVWGPPLEPVRTDHDPELA